MNSSPAERLETLVRGALGKLPRLGIDAAVLFGSRIYGIPRADSDIDLAIFSGNAERWRSLDNDRWLDDLEKQAGARPELHILSRQELRDAWITNFAGHILSHGRLLVRPAEEVLKQARSPRPDPEDGRMNDDVKYWLKVARYDFETAVENYKAGRYVSVYTHNHDALEKLLKGLYVQNLRTFPPKSHELVALARKAKASLTQRQGTFLRKLQKDYGNSRYPESIKDFDALDNRAGASSSLRQTKSLFAAWEKRLTP